MSWRTVVITRPCKLRLEQGRLVITGEAGEAKVPLEDIAAVQIDCSEVLLTAPVLSACAGAGISLTVCDVTHTPNGVLLPFHTHSRATGVMRRQLALTQPRKKRLWQRVVQQKILNQAANLPADGRAQRQMLRLARSVNSGDPENREATAAGLYFQHAFEEPLLRREPEPLNGPLNYCYAVVRSAIARALVLHGLLPAFGIHHDNERNAFNLADDLFEPYRPLVDRHVAQLVDQFGLSEGLTPQLKGKLVGILHVDHTDTDSEGSEHRTVLNLIDQTVVSYLKLLDGGNPAELVLPLLSPR